MPSNELLVAIDVFLFEWRNDTSEKLVKLAPAFLAQHDLNANFPQHDRFDFRYRWQAIRRWRSIAAYNANRHLQLLDGNFGFWVYRCNYSPDCPDHTDWNGFCAPPDHPIWLTHFPANSWFCSCHVAGARTRPGILRVGGDPDKGPPLGWDHPDPATGLPPGIEPDFTTPGFPGLAACLDALDRGVHRRLAPATPP